MKIKFCGISNKQMAIAAVAAGADYIGFNFVPSSRRYVSPQQAKSIIADIQGKVKVVGVFQNHPLSELNQIAKYLQLDYIQCHGSETPSYCRLAIKPVIKAIPITASADTETILTKIRSFDCPFFLLDREIQGTGNVIDLKIARIIAGTFPCFIAGGLTPENVGEAITMTQPYGVDVAAGIETNSIYDSHKMKDFVINSRVLPKPSSP